MSKKVILKTLVGNEIVGWGHNWKQALAGPCPHFKGKWPPEPFVLTCVIVPESPFQKRGA